ncbi:zinc finger protein [Reticulomyxa filosa]|uniref:Zinc finger protein n=1 Tax=Reticulomyxa filosa TaxID=46433 RepID=X6NU92_RETFI|nr:zinc finger protein [Reticulomyxa filosa]|eukprot:ETO29586.1 zinc finger protein [Reticulomyxa filosa]
MKYIIDKPKMTDIEPSKYKQLQLKYFEERKYWMEKAKELRDQIVKMEQTLKTTQHKLRDKVEQNVLFQTQVQMLQQQIAELPPQTRVEAQERAKFKQQEEKKARESQQVLHKQIDVQKQQLLQVQALMDQQQLTIEDLQNNLRQSKEMVTQLERKLEDTQSDLAKQVPTSSKELLQQQIKVLKSQRKVLVKEVNIFSVFLFFSNSLLGRDDRNRSRTFVNKMSY